MGYSSWQKFPSWHPLYGTGGRGYTPDVTLGLEVTDMSAQARAARANNRKTISISAEHLFQGSNIHDFGRYADVDLAIAADAEATLPSLIEEIRRQTTAARKSAIQARGARVAAAHKEAQLTGIRDARHGWDASPVSVPRLVAELGDQIANDDWAIVSGHQFTGDWQRRLLNHDKHYRYNGDCGGFGIGYDTPASVGGALAHKKAGRLSIGIVGDGDLNFSPGVLWTAAHHKIPLLFVVHNNRAYHAEVMIIQRMCGVRGRGNENAPHRQRHRRSESELRGAGQGVRSLQRRTDREPEGSGGRVPARAGQGQGRRAGARRGRLAAAVTSHDSRHTRGTEALRL